VAISRSVPRMMGNRFRSLDILIEWSVSMRWVFVPLAFAAVSLTGHSVVNVVLGQTGCTFQCVTNPGCNKPDVTCGGTLGVSACVNCGSLSDCPTCTIPWEFDYNPNEATIHRADPGGIQRVEFVGNVTCWKTRPCGSAIVWGPYWTCHPGGCQGHGRSDQYCKDCAGLGTWTPYEIPKATCVECGT
jgi:hypothetical protein